MISPFGVCKRLVTVKVLLITASRIGDCVLSTGLLDHLAQKNPQARFTIACGSAAQSLFCPAPYVERIIPMVKRKRAGHWLDLWRQTCGQYWSLVVDLRGSAMAYMVPTLRRRVIRSSWQPQHRLVHLSSVLGLTEPLAPKLYNTQDQVLQAAALIPDGPVLAIGPTANWGGKQWPAERFADVARILTAPGAILGGAPVAVFGAEHERPMIQSMLDGLADRSVIDLVGRVDLPTIHACLRRCSLYVGNDSGLMHIAAASGVRTLGLFGPSSEVFYGPFGSHCRSVRGPRSFEDICHAPDYDYRSHKSLMLDLTVEAVVKAAGTLWQETSKP